MNEPEFLETPDLATRWRTTPAAIHQMRHRGQLPQGYRVGRKVLYRRVDIEAFEEDQLRERRIA